MPTVSLLDLAMDESTLQRWCSWFLGELTYWIGCLSAIAHRTGLCVVEDLVISSSSSLQVLFRYVGKSPGWLKRIVRQIVNMKLWL